MWAAWTLVGAEQVVAHISKSEEAQRASKELCEAHLKRVSNVCFSSSLTALEALVKVLANSSPVKKGTRKQIFSSLLFFTL